MLLNKKDIESLDNSYRGLFINALSGMKAAHLIATCDQHKRSNLAIFTSVFHIGLHPPLLGMITRPHSAPGTPWKTFLRQNITASTMSMSRSTSRPTRHPHVIIEKSLNFRPLV